MHPCGSRRGRGRAAAAASGALCRGPSLLNQSPAAVFIRLPHPRSLYISVNYTAPPLSIRLAATGFAVAVLLVAASRLLRIPREERGRLAEASLLVAASVLLSTIVWAPYTALLTLPLLLCLDHAWNRRDALVGGLTGFFYLALGPFHLLFINLVVVLPECRLLHPRVVHVLPLVPTPLASIHLLPL